MGIGHGLLAIRRLRYGFVICPTIGFFSGTNQQHPWVTRSLKLSRAVFSVTRPSGLGIPILERPTVSCIANGFIHVGLNPLADGAQVQRLLRNWLRLIYDSPEEHAIIPNRADPPSRYPACFAIVLRPTAGQTLLAWMPVKAEHRSRAPGRQPYRPIAAEVNVADHHALT